MPKVMTAGARPGRLHAGSRDEREGDALRSREIRETASAADASASATAEQRITPAERLDSSNVGTAREFGPSQNPMAVSPEPVDPDNVRRRNAFQTGSRELARFLRQNGDAFTQAQEAAEGDASGFAQAWMEDFDRRAGEVFNSIPSEVRALFGNDFEALRAESFAQADSFERDRRILAIRDRVDAARRLYGGLVEDDPETFGSALALMEDMIRSSDLRPDLIESELMQTRRLLFESHRRARLEGDNPETLLRDLEGGRFEGLLPTEEMQEILSQTAAEVGQRQREAVILGEVDVETRARRELQRIFDTETSATPTSEEEVLATFPGERGQVMAARLREGRAARAAWQRIAAAQPIEVAKILAELRRTVGEDSDLFRGFMMAVTERNRRLRDDPRQYALMHSPHVQRMEAEATRAAAEAADPALTPEERSEKQRVAARKKRDAVEMSMRVQELLKGNNDGLRVLSKQEASDLVAELGVLSPKQQVERLTSLERVYDRHSAGLLNELMASGLSPDQGGTALLVFSDASPVVLQNWIAVQGQSIDQLWEKVPQSEVEAIAEGLLIRSSGVSGVMVANGRRQERQARLDMALRLALQLKISGHAAPVVTAAAAFFPFERVSGHVMISKELLRNALAEVEEVRERLDERLKNMRLGGEQPSIAFDFVGAEPEEYTLEIQQLKETVEAPGQTVDELDERLWRGRFWRSAPGGIQLMDAAGRPIVAEDGSIRTVPWEEILRPIRASKFAVPIPLSGVRG